MPTPALFFDDLNSFNTSVHEPTTPFAKFKCRQLLFCNCWNQMGWDLASKPVTRHHGDWHPLAFWDALRLFVAVHWGFWRGWRTVCFWTDRKRDRVTQDLLVGIQSWEEAFHPISSMYGILMYTVYLILFAFIWLFFLVIHVVRYAIHGWTSMVYVLFCGFAGFLELFLGFLIQRPPDLLTCHAVSNDNVDIK